MATMERCGHTIDLSNVPLETFEREGIVQTSSKTIQVFRGEVVSAIGDGAKMHLGNSFVVFGGGRVMSHHHTWEDAWAEFCKRAGRGTRRWRAGCEENS